MPTASAGLVYDDGGSSAPAVSAATARSELTTLAGGHAVAGVQRGAGAATSACSPPSARPPRWSRPTQPSLSQSFPFTPSVLKPPEAATNLATFGYDTDVKTSQARVRRPGARGQLNTSVSPAGWSSAGAITPIDRWASMLAGAGMTNVDGSEWYFPQRLTDDTGAVDQGNANPAQKVLDVDATMGHRLPTDACASTPSAPTAARSSPRTRRRWPSRAASRVATCCWSAARAPTPTTTPRRPIRKNAFFSNLMTFLARIAKG